MNNEITAYIQTQIQKGLTGDEIAAQLRNGGWTEPNIQSAFAAYKKTLTPNPAIQTTPQSAVSRPNIPAQLPPPLQKGKLKTGWLLFKQSFAIIRSNPALWRYMLITLGITVGISLITAGVFLADYFGPRLLTYTSKAYDSASNESSSINATLLGYGVLIVFAYLSTAVTYFFAVALSAHVLALFRGENPTNKDMIAVAKKKMVAILTYALIATTIGYILRAIEDRFRLVGWIIARIFGVIWTLATTFVIPVIAETDDNSVTAIKKSIGLFKKSWGQTLVSRVALGGLLFLIYLLIMIPVTIVLTILLTSLLGIIGFIIALSIFIIGILILSVLNSLATNVLNVALYYYAEHGVVPPSFSPELLASAFAPKKRKK